MNLFVGLSNIDPSPLYEQIEKQIIGQIMDGKLQPGFLLPSIRALAKELSTSVITVKKAYEDLEMLGYIITRSGMGSFVADVAPKSIKEAAYKSAEEYFEKGISECRKLKMEDNDILKTFKAILDV